MISLHYCIIDLHYSPSYINQPSHSIIQLQNIPIYHAWSTNALESNYDQRDKRKLRKSFWINHIFGNHVHVTVWRLMIMICRVCYSWVIASRCSILFSSNYLSCVATLSSPFFIICPTEINQPALFLDLSIDSYSLDMTDEQASKHSFNRALHSFVISEHVTHNSVIDILIM